MFTPAIANCFISIAVALPTFLICCKFTTIRCNSTSRPTVAAIALARSITVLRACPASTLAPINALFADSKLSKENGVLVASSIVFLTTWAALAELPKRVVRPVVAFSTCDPTSTTPLPNSSSLVTAKAAPIAAPTFNAVDCRLFMLPSNFFTLPSASLILPLSKSCNDNTYSTRSVAIVLFFVKRTEGGQYTCTTDHRLMYRGQFSNDNEPNTPTPSNHQLRFRRILPLLIYP